MSTPQRLTHLDELAALVPADARVLVLTTPARRHLDELLAQLETREVQVFDQAEVHVPTSVVTSAREAIGDGKPTHLISLGGGAATGLAKALRQDHPDASFIAVPTTFSGSEFTRIWGVSAEGSKQTGRDDWARPDHVVHDPALIAGLPAKLAVPSIFNALAHPISALWAGIEDESSRREALRAITETTFAARQLLGTPEVDEFRVLALAATARAANVLDQNAMGLHHKVAHLLGGALQLPHALLHSILLPHTLRRIREEAPEVHADIHRAFRMADPAAFIHDGLRRVGVATGLRGLSVSLEQLESLISQMPEAEPLLRGAWLGSRPSETLTYATWELADRAPIDLTIDGDLEVADALVLALHGRGSTATRVIEQLREATGHTRALAIVAPQASDASWYPQAYDADPEDLEPSLGPVVSQLSALLDRLHDAAAGRPIYLFGFSQGACLALELSTRSDVQLAGLICPAGARPGRLNDWPARYAGVSVLLSIADDDRWIRAEDVENTAEALAAKGALVTLLRRPGQLHAIDDLDRHEIRRLLALDPQPPHGYGGHHEANALPGAVPRGQNSPLRPPYGLYPEQLSGTGFVAKRHENHRTWAYRIRPSAQHRAFETLEHPTFVSDFDPEALINLEAWLPPQHPEGKRDFIDGIVTIGGAGHPSLRRGYAVHLFDANASMHERSFTNADGDMVILPQQGELLVLSEMGSLEVKPGQVLVVPRGLRFSVVLRGRHARGYIGEAFAKHFELPQRGLVGANALADERHFVGPAVFYEDRLAPGYRMSSKMGGVLYEARQDHSPYDVVGWHGSYLPYVYDVSDFAAVNNTRVDHPDPSIFSLLSAGLDEQGAHGLDLVIFPARWDPTEHTFRPPFFHRNVTTEINGIIRDPGLGKPFEPGMVFVTPSMTAHGIRAHAVDANLARDPAASNKPWRSNDAALWFQFETALPFCPTPWAKAAENRFAHWEETWGSHASHFDPRKPDGHQD